jgi:hypothetical protein
MCQLRISQDQQKDTGGKLRYADDCCFELHCKDPNMYGTYRGIPIRPVVVMCTFCREGRAPILMTSTSCQTGQVEHIFQGS